jgi:hypothetical protein
MPENEPAIANYDDQTADEIKQRLRTLSQADLGKLEAYEKQGQARSTVLEAIAALRTDAPWSGYDEMEVEEINDALRQRDGDAAARVLDYERHHKARITVIEFAKRRREESDGSSRSESAPRRSPDESSSASSSSEKSAKSSGGGGGRRSQSNNASRSRAQSSKASTTRSSQSKAPAIANYDDHTADEIMQRVRRLSQSELAELEAYEKQGQGRTTVLETIAALRGDEPWSGYDDMEVEEVNDALKRRDRDTAARVLDYERRHKGRKTIVEFASARREASEGSSASGQSSRSPSRPKRATSKSSSATSRGGSASRSASRSARGRASKAAPTRTRAKQQTRRSQGGSRARSQSRSTSRPRTQSRKPAAKRASQPESPVKEALQAAAALLRQRAAEALRSAEAPTKKLAKDTGHAVGSAAQAAPARLRDRAAEALQTAEGPTKKLAKDTEQAVGSAAHESRDAIGTAVRDSGQAVAAAAHKAKGPALVGAAALATVGGGIALGSKVKLRRRKRVLGVTVPRRTAVDNAAKRVGRAVDSASLTGQLIGQWSDDIQYLRARIAGAHVRVGSRREREGRV